MPGRHFCAHFAVFLGSGEQAEKSEDFQGPGLGGEGPLWLRQSGEDWWGMPFTTPAAGLKAWRGVSTVACAPKTATMPDHVSVCANPGVFDPN